MSMEAGMHFIYSKKLLLFWNYEFCFLKIPCHITATSHFSREKHVLTIQPISCYRSLSTPTENIRKPLIF